MSNIYFCVLSAPRTRADACLARSLARKQPCHVQALPTRTWPCHVQVLLAYRVFSFFARSLARARPITSSPVHISGANLFSLVTVLPKRVEQLFAEFEQVPYTKLKPSVNPLEADEELVFHNGRFVTKPIDRTGETRIDHMHWSNACKVAVERTRHYHGDSRANALAAHHEVVDQLAMPYTWPVAVAYDIQQRTVWASNPMHDISQLDERALSLVISKQSIATLQQSVAHPVSSGQPTSPAKRTASQHTADRPPKRAVTRNSNSPTGGMITCFRCGGAGHYPRNCSASVTRTGSTCATLSPNTRSQDGLMSASGRDFCFQFAVGHCARGNACVNLHACSICDATSHGARACTAGC